MIGDQFRDLHFAQTRTGSGIEAFQEYHFRREDSLLGDPGFEGTENGCVVLHIAAPCFLDPVDTRRADVARLSDDVDRFPLIERGDLRGDRVVFESTGVAAEIDSEFDDGKAATRIGRHGILEAVSTAIFGNGNRKGAKSILAMEKLEKSFVALADIYHRCFSESVDEQPLITVSYRNLAGVQLTGGNGHPRALTISEDTIRVQPSRIGSGKLREELIPVIRPLWNAVSRESSIHISEEGWKLE